MSSTLRSFATLSALLPEAAKRWPDRPALVTELGERSWAWVDRQSAGVASCLVDSGVRPGDRVVVVLHKTSASFITMHGVLRAGAVAVPIDPLAPAATIASVTTSVGARAAIVDAHTVARTDPWSSSMAVVIGLGIDDPRATSFEDACAHPVVELPDPAPSDPAYMIFTSGSTGTPKGIVHSHRSGLAYARLAAETHDLRIDDRLAGMPPLHFDMSTFELYAAPLVGAVVVPVSDVELRLPASFVEKCETERITVWYSVPFQLRQIEQRGALERRDLSSLRHVIYAGEPYPPGALRELMSALPQARFSNAYGPAETNVCTVFELEGPPSGDAGIPLGRPWGEVEVRVVDVLTGKDVPSDEPGELWVSAETVMSEYWHLPELTSERLLPRGDGRHQWYRTGDLVRADEAGCLHFLGRIDTQVKVRGVRLELEAIESVLTDAPGVAHAVVGARVDDGGADGIVAAIVPSPKSEALDPVELRRWCAGRLASVAVPMSYMEWEEFPLTPSGKIDRATVRCLLAEPDTASPTTESSP